MPRSNAPHPKTKGPAYASPDTTIHTGLCVRDGDWINQLPEKVRENMDGFGNAIVALIHLEGWKGGITSKDVDMKYKSLCSPGKHENMFARGYWKKDSVTILDVTFKGKPLELIVVGHNNDSPMTVKRHIRAGRYGDKVPFDTKISVPCVPYIYKNKSKYTYFEI